MGFGNYVEAFRDERGFDGDSGDTLPCRIGHSPGVVITCNNVPVSNEVILHGTVSPERSVKRTPLQMTRIVFVSGKRALKTAGLAGITWPRRLFLS